MAMRMPRMPGEHLPTLMLKQGHIALPTVANHMHVTNAPGMLMSPPLLFLSSSTTSQRRSLFLFVGIIKMLHLWALFTFHDLL